MNHFKQPIKTIFSFILVSLCVPLFFQAHADVCNPPEEWYNKIQSSFQRDIRDTVMNQATSATSDFLFHVITNAEMAEYMNCLDYVAPNFPRIQNELTAFGCNRTPEEVCRGMVNQYKTACVGDPATDPTCTNNLHHGFDRVAFSKSKISGSLLGMAYGIQNYLQYEPVPVNTAYFFKDYAYKIPVLGERALAADVNYQNTLISGVLDIWKITRNVAYALMSVIMIWVGIIIITRKKISQQVVVNVQYALPKIVISLVLIAFSYPIGATMASLSWSLFNSAPVIINSLSTAAGGMDAPLRAGLDIGVGGSFLTLMAILFAGGGVGLAVGLATVIVMLIAVIMYLWCLIKALMLFLKMIASTVTAPLLFAIGAIPGNEDKISNWFKQMLAWGLGIAGINITLNLVQLFVVTIINSGGVTLGGAFPALSGALYAIFGGLFLFIFGFGFASKVPDQIQNGIMGKPKR
jgi:hypothetical protein